MSIGKNKVSFQFNGNALEYFQIWIVNLTLTILTLGIYSAWAKVRTKRYFYRSLILEGSAFEYHARPIDILKGRIIVFVIYVLYAVLTEVEPIASIVMLILFWLAVPWLIVRAHTFNARNSSWRGIRFGFRQGTIGEAVRVFLLFPILLLPTLFLITPYLSFKGWRFAIGNSLFGRSPFSFSANAGSYYRAWFNSIGITLVAAIFLLGLASLFLIVPSIIDGDIELMDGIGTGGIGILQLLPLLITLLFMVGYFVYRVLTRNISLSGSGVGDHRLESTVSAWGLGKIYILNTIAIILSAGLMIPWAKVRVARYQAEHLFLHLDGDLDSFIQSEQQDNRALGEEGADFMDVDIGGI